MIFWALETTSFVLLTLWKLSRPNHVLYVSVFVDTFEIDIELLLVLTGWHSSCRWNHWCDSAVSKSQAICGERTGSALVFLSEQPNQISAIPAARNSSSPRAERRCPKGCA
jgi:hypothetical protein